METPQKYVYFTVKRCKVYLTPSLAIAPDRILEKQEESNEGLQNPDKYNYPNTIEI
jgi:hypothetical protein